MMPIASALESRSRALLDSRRDGHGMPRAFYLDEALYAAEMATIWQQGWIFAGFDVRDPEPRRLPDARRSPIRPCS